MPNPNYRHRRQVNHYRAKTERQCRQEADDLDEQLAAWIADQRAKMTPEQRALADTAYQFAREAEIAAARAREIEHERRRNDPYSTFGT